MSETRDHLLQTAGELFRSRGYEMVGINEIIAKSGVAKATFYAHFKSKAGLCAEWLGELSRTMTRNNEALLAASDTPVEKVSRVYGNMEQFLFAGGFHNCPFTTTASMAEDNPEILSVIRTFKEDSLRFWRRLAEQAGVGDPVAVGDALFLLYSGALSEAQNFREVWPVRSACASAVRLIAGG